MNLAELKEAYKARKLALDSAKKEEEKYKALLKDAMLEAGESDYTDEAGYRFERIVQERKSMDEEAKEGDLSSGFDGFEIETQEIYEKDEYIQLMAEKNSSLEEQATDLQLALADVYEQMLGLSAN